MVRNICDNCLHENKLKIVCSKCLKINCSECSRDCHLCFTKQVNYLKYIIPIFLSIILKLFIRFGKYTLYYYIVIVVLIKQCLKIKSIYTSIRKNFIFICTMSIILFCFPFLNKKRNYEYNY